MGAYANPQEIEGQFDITQQGAAYQNMFNSITKSTIGVISQIEEKHRETAKRNQAIIDSSEEKAGQLQLLFEKGKGREKKGLTYDCYQTAIEDYKELQKKIGFGTATPEDKRKAAQIVASVSNFSDAAGDLNEEITTYQKAKKMVGDGSININGSDPDYVRALEALANRDGGQIQPGFQEIEGGYDYTQHGYNLAEWTYTDKTTNKTTVHPARFINAADLSKALEGNLPHGIIYNKTYANKVDKIKTIAPNIFEQKDGVPTGQLTSQFLEQSHGTPKQVEGAAQNGIYRQLFLKPNYKVIGDDKIFDSNINAMNQASINTQNEAQSLYFGAVKPVIDKNKDNADYDSQDPYLKYMYVPEEEEGKVFDYNKAILPDKQPKLVENLKHNMRAAVLQSLPKEQATGQKYFVSTLEIKAEEALTNWVNDKKKSAEHAKKSGSDKDYYNIIRNQFKAATVNNVEPKEIIYSMPVPTNGGVINKNFLVKKDKDGKYTMQIIP